MVHATLSHVPPSVGLKRLSFRERLSDAPCNLPHLAFRPRRKIDAPLDHDTIRPSFLNHPSPKDLSTERVAGPMRRQVEVQVRNRLTEYVDKDDVGAGCLAQDSGHACED